jgi:hypothetical protein
MRMLAELAEIGMEVARAVGRQAAEGPVLERGLDLTLAFSRASRAVRLTLMLQSRLLAPPSPGKDHGQDAGDGAAEPLTGERRRARARELVERFVRDEHEGDEQTVERLMAEAAERLEVEEDIDGKRMGQIVSLICNDLLLSPRRVEMAQALFDDDDEPWNLPAPTSGAPALGTAPAPGLDLARIASPFVSPLLPPAQAAAAAEAARTLDPPRRLRGALLYPPRPFPRAPHAGSG